MLTKQVLAEILLFLIQNASPVVQPNIPPFISLFDLLNSGIWRSLRFFAPYGLQKNGEIAGAEGGAPPNDITLNSKYEGGMPPLCEPERIC